jgi:hypothetical protein
MFVASPVAPHQPAMAYRDQRIPQMHTTYYRADPATLGSVQVSSTGDADRVREALAQAISLSGRGHWTWKPGRLRSAHDDGGRLRCVWADRQSLVRYHRYLDLAWESLTGSDDLEHVLSGAAL